MTSTASTSDVACWVLAVDAEGGRSAQAVTYQGTLAKLSPTLAATFPTVLHPGGAPATFTVWRRHKGHPQTPTTGAATA